MRRSQAPSFRKSEKSSSNNQTPGNPPFRAREESVRSNDEVLKLLLGKQSERIEEEGATTNVKETVGKENEPAVNGINPGSLSEGGLIYNVVYGKQSKRKHKVWEGDGTLEIGVKSLTLKDENGKVIGTLSANKSKPIEEGSRLLIGSKEVEVIELRQCSVSEVTKKATDEVQHIVKKRKINGKGFIVPVSHSEKTGFVLPEPSPEHQWHFNEDNLPVTPVCIEGHLSRRLRRHQFAGIVFLYECIMGFKARNMFGAILADEMGLGKTLQTISLIWTLLKQGPYGNKPVVKKVLIVTPSSLTMNWHNEFIKWLGRERLVPYVIDSKKKPRDMTSPVMIVSYEMFVRCYDDIKDIPFDLLICDEGHRLKNSNIRTNQLLQSLACHRRILLTGTPIQNDLKEFYTLVDFVNPNILGTPSEFRRCFEEPILASRHPDADNTQLRAGEEAAAEVKEKTSLFLLRRTKEVLDDYLPAKNDVVVFCRAANVQRDVYNHAINALIDNSEMGFSDGVFHLGVIASLKKICNHPALLWTRDADEVKEDVLLSKITVMFPNLKNNYESSLSTKMSIVMDFLRELKETSPKERVVIVSNSTQTLDLLEKKISELGYASCRLDGSTPASQRSTIVDRFNLVNSNLFVFLLSSKAGGVGLNLTGASRLILYDMDWNPATDLQAMSRIWRDGQKRRVYIYRLLTSGTIEEKIYQRQINKQGLSDGIVDTRNADVIKLSSEDLKDLFTYCDNSDGSLTHEMLSCDCSRNGVIPLRDGNDSDEEDGGEEVEGRRRRLFGRCRTDRKMNELLHWEHHGSPVSPSVLAELCLSRSGGIVDFVFRNSKG